MCKQTRTIQINIYSFYTQINSEQNRKKTVNVYLLLDN